MNILKTAKIKGFTVDEWGDCEIKQEVIMKKILSAIMSVTMTLASLSISGASAKGNNTAKTIDTIAFVSTIRGDINCDGKTNKLDHDIVRAYNKAISAGEEYTKKRAFHKA